MTAPRVVFVNRYFYPDTSATSQMLTDAVFDLACGGFDVSVITSRQQYDNASAQQAAHEVIRTPSGAEVKVYRVWSTRFGRGKLAGRSVDYLSFYLAAAVVLWRRSRRGTVVVAKTDPPMLSVLAAPVAKLRGALLVNWLQDVFPEAANALGIRAARGPLFALLRRLRNASLRSARMNVVLGDRMAARLESEGVPARQVRVIPNWADGTQVRPTPFDANALRSEWGLADRFVVGYSGNLGRAHEFDAILGAAALLRERKDIVFLFIGAGAQRSAVEAGAGELGLNNVVFRPYQPRERLALSLGVAHVHLVSLNPALEGLIVPSKFYGIAAAGRPTLFVGDPDGEVAREVNAAHCGRVVRGGDSTGLAQAIAELASDQRLCEEMGANARTMFDGKFDRPIALRGWKEVLSGVHGREAHQ